MRATLALTLVALLATGSAAGAVDMRDTDAVVTAFNAHTGRDASAAELCVVSEPGFPGVAVIGALDDGRGCAVALVLVGDDWLEPAVASASALARAGWAEADADRRAALALGWVRLGVFPFHEVVEDGGEDFARPGAPAFAAPAVSAEAGNTVVTLWVREPTAMSDRREYLLWALSYDRDGRQVRIRVLDDHVVDP